MSSRARTSRADRPASGRRPSRSRRSGGTIQQERKLSSVGASCTRRSATRCLYSSTVTGMARPPTIVDDVAAGVRHTHIEALDLDGPLRWRGRRDGPGRPWLSAGRGEAGLELLAEEAGGVEIQV